MKIKNLILLFVSLAFAANIFADDTPSEDELNYEDPRLKNYKERYEESFDKSFDEVWEATISSIEELNCMLITKNTSQNDEGFLKGKIKSDFCVFSSGKDSTFKVLQRESLEVPFIRGGSWISGRKQYTIVLKEQEDGTVNMILKCEISGREDHVTKRIHFWKSVGNFETDMIESIKSKLNS